MITDAMVQLEQTSKVPNNPQIIKGIYTASNLPLSDKEVVTPTRVPIPTMSVSQNSSDKVNSSNTPCKRLTKANCFEDLGTSHMLSPKLYATKRGKYCKKT
ncbi:unnamed protein product [Lathyrus oleraceus]